MQQVTFIEIFSYDINWQCGICLYSYICREGDLGSSSTHGFQAIIYSNIISKLSFLAVGNHSLLWPSPEHLRSYRETVVARGHHSSLWSCHNESLPQQLESYDLSHTYQMTETHVCLTGHLLVFDKICQPTFEIRIIIYNRFYQTTNPREPRLPND